MNEKRENGTGTITQRKDGQWEGRIRYRDRGHKLCVKACYADTKEECEVRLKELRKIYGVIDRSQCSEFMSFNEWAEIWLQHERVNISQSTYETYKSQISLYFRDRIGDLPLNEITSETIGRMYSDLRQNGRIAHVELYGEGVSLGTIHTINRLLKNIFKKAVEMRIISINPSLNCKIPKNKYKELYIFSKSEVREIFKRAKDEDIYLGVLLALTTGLHRGELVSLRWRDINFSTGELKVSRVMSCTKIEPEITKLRKPSLYRSIYLPNDMLEELHSYKKASKSNWLFPSKYLGDRPKNPNDFTLKFKKIVREMGIERASFSSLRDTFAVEALNHGVDVKTLSCALGNHSVRGVMRAYVPLMEKYKRKAAEKIEDAMINILSK